MEKNTALCSAPSQTKEPEEKSLVTISCPFVCGGSGESLEFIVGKHVVEEVRSIVKRLVIDVEKPIVDLSVFISLISPRNSYKGILSDEAFVLSVLEFVLNPIWQTRAASLEKRLAYYSGIMKNVSDHGIKWHIENKVQGYEASLEDEVYGAVMRTTDPK